MSAKVFSLFAMSDARPRPSSPRQQDVDRVRRVLFPPLDLAKARQFVASELASCRKVKSEQLNFDFERGVPIESADSRYRWKRVDTTTERVPEAYSLERLPYLGSHADTQAEEEETPKNSENKSATSAKQSSITDFMPKRKKMSCAGGSKTNAGTRTSTITTSGSSVQEPQAKKQKTASS